MSCGATAREKEMIGVLQERLDLTAVLDATDPESPPPICELFDLPNVIITPHIAGSMNHAKEVPGNHVASLARFL